jgi:hypothetical protein
MNLHKRFKTRRALLISGGISTYQNYARYLNDLTAFYSCLVSARYGFDPNDIQVLYASRDTARSGNFSCMICR